MNETSRSALPVATQEALGVRLLHLLLFAVVFWVLCWAVALTAIVQLVLRVFAGASNADLRRFGSALARYAAQVIAYLSFASDRLPFPFSEWPDETPAADDPVGR